ncbi:MAG: hypothetical protein HQM06_05675 [Magnetococcales bacterium]|nr:hypothetical protein [Magnetococcales bacterium]
MLLQLQHQVDSASKACINRSVPELSLALHENRALGRYYKEVQAGRRLLDDDPWTRLRAQADQYFFHGFHEEIHFAALTLNDSGMSSYGSCCLLLKEALIDERASLFRENTGLYFREHQPSEKNPVTPGWRAVWAERGMLAACKLQEQLTTTTASSDFADLLIQFSPEDAELDDFLEVHIYGSLTIKTVQQVVISPQSGEESQTDRLTKRLEERKIPFQIA